MELQHLAEVSRNEAIVFGHRLSVHLRFGGHLMMTAAGSNGVGLGVEGGARRKRRSWSVAERQRIVGAAVTPGASVAGVARANGVNANLVFKWIRRSAVRPRSAGHRIGRPGSSARR